MLEVVALLQGALKLDDLFFGAAAAYCGAHVGQQLFVVPGLLNEVGRARLHGVDGVLDRAIGGDHDDRQLGVAFADLLQNLDTVALGQREIQQHQVEGPLGEAGQAFHAVVGGVDGVAFKLQQRLQRLADRGFVVDDQHRAG